MRLLNTATLTLETFIGVDKPHYATLSHTWGGDEVLFEDIQDTSTKRWKKKFGAPKILASARKASRKGLSYIWIDTCCIDKSSSAELSEAINSMYQWYAASDVCYAYLSDVGDIIEGRVSFEQSRWFSRGWTLQELIAPGKVELFDATWKSIGTRSSLATAINAITRIDISLLKRNPKRQFEMENRLEALSVHSKMLWAYMRETTRPEDRTYSLMGIFNVNMPLLYGEGGDKAFQRLQEEIIKGSNDQSILLHTGLNGPLARSPDQFLPTHAFQKNPKNPQYLLERLKFGLRISLLLYLLPLKRHGNTLGIVDSLFADDPSKLCRPALLLQNTENDSEYCLYSSGILKVQPIASGALEVINVSNGIRVCSFDHDKLKRKVIDLYEQGNSRHRSLVDTLQNPTLSLRPIVHKTPSLLYKYGICYPKAHRSMVTFNYEECLDVSLDLRVVAAISLESLRHQCSSVVMLIFATLEGSWKHVFAHLVALRDWLGPDESTHFSLLDLSLVHARLPRLPIARKASLSNYDDIAAALLKTASNKACGPVCSIEMFDGVNITVELRPTQCLEDEILAVDVEINESREAFWAK